MPHHFFVGFTLLTTVLQVVVQESEDERQAVFHFTLRVDLGRLVIVPRGKPSLAPQHRLVVPLQQQLIQAQVLVDVNLDVGIVAVEA